MPTDQERYSRYWKITDALDTVRGVFVILTGVFVVFWWIAVVSYTVKNPHDSFYLWAYMILIPTWGLWELVSLAIERYARKVRNGDE
jgi:uncharacterized protein affecting Mg2+/Co2+ transport